MFFTSKSLRIEKCINLRVITLSGSGISNLDPLIDCKNIFHCKDTRWNEDTDVWSRNTEVKIILLGYNRIDR